jgi:uncharacterized protein DUF2608
MCYNTFSKSFNIKVLMKKTIYSYFILMLCVATTYLSADISRTTDIEAILPSIEEDTLMLFNIAEVLTDTPTSLGSSAWRKYIRKRVTSEQHDWLTHYIFKHLPHKAVDEKTVVIIQQLQEQGIPVFAFTSRGRHEWYASQIPDIDLLTENVLKSIGFDFRNTRIPQALVALSDLFPSYYHDGIVYSGNEIEKGELLATILKETGYQPSSVVFVDDKEDSLKISENAVEQLNIPFKGFVYEKTLQDHTDFDPVISTIQLEWLFFKDTILSDDDAIEIKSTLYQDIDPEVYLADVVMAIQSAIKQCSFCD